MTRNEQIADAVNAFFCADHELIGQVEGAFYRVKYFVNSDGVHLVLMEDLAGDSIIDIIEHNSPST